jgi:nucleotide-binding universal stress UspA family protein
MALPQVVSPRSAFHTLLVPTDLSARSANALSFAAALARRSNAKVVVAHVVSPGRWHSDEVHPALCHERRLTEKRLARVLKSHNLVGVQTDTVIREGDFRQVLCQIACEQRADLLVASTHGRTGISKLLFGSKVEEVCHRSPCPVLLVGPKVKKEAPEKFERVLFTTDLSAASLGALPFMVAFATEHGSQLRVARIVAENEAKESGDGAEFICAQTKNEILPALTARAGLAHEPEFVVEFGPANTTILEIASKWGADLIGMGAHRPGALAVYLPGDLAYDVACEAQCPVLTIVD